MTTLYLGTQLDIYFKQMKRLIVLLSIASLIFVSCNPYRYGTPGVQPAGKSQLTKKQIKRDLTN